MKESIIMLFCLLAVVAVGITGIYLDDNSITSHHRIEPKITVTIHPDGTVDSLFVYEKGTEK